MKPITDDIVLSLIEGAKQRQKKNGSANCARATRSNAQSDAKAEGGKIISLDFSRPVRRVRQSMSGVFFYTPRP